MESRTLEARHNPRYARRSIVPYRLTPSLAAVVALCLWTQTVSATSQTIDAATVSAALGRAQDDAARRALLDANPAWATSPLLTSVLEAARKAGDPVEAETGFVAAAALAERLGDQRATGDAYEGLGFLLFQLGRLVEAQEAQRRGIPAAEAAGDPDTLVDLLRFYSISERLRGRMEAAVEPAERALRTARAQGNARQTASLLGDLGLLHQDLGDLRRRDALLREALEIAERHSLTAVARNLNNNLGAALVSQGDLEAGVGYLRKVIDSVAPGTGGDGAVITGHAYANIGIAELRLGRYRESLAAYEEALTRFTAQGDQRNMALTRANIGELFRVQGDFARARPILEESVRLHDAHEYGEGRSEARANLAWTRLGLGDHEGARAIAREAVTIAKANRMTAQIIKSSAPLGEALRVLGERTEARRVLEEAIELVEVTRRNLAGGGLAGEAFLEDYIPPYHALVALEVDEGRPRAALAAAERTKARQFFDLLRPGRAGIARALSPPEREEEQRLTGEVTGRQVALAEAETAGFAAAQAQLTEAIGRLEAFRSTLYRNHPELRFQRGDLAPLTDQDLAPLVGDASMALIEFVVAERESFALVVTGQPGGALEITAHRLPIGRDALQREIEAFRTQLGTRDLGVRKSARSLYDRVLGPMAARLKRRTVVGIVPDGPLWNLPAAALLAPSGRYLVEDLAIFFSPSLTALATLHRRDTPSGAPTLLAMAAPAPGAMPVPMAALSRTAAEVTALSRVYGANGALIVTGTEAREDRWKTEAPRYRVLHLATHGVLNGANPLYSYLVLGRGDTPADDGFLEAREVLDMSLGADLVVLSACETGGGRFRYGEGQVGLSWAFLVAGARTAVVSQWKVDEASTSQLMTAFHRAMLAPGRSPLTARALALQQAARQLSRSRFSHPFYWAAFTMIGDGY